METVMRPSVLALLVVLGLCLPAWGVRGVDPAPVVSRVDVAIYGGTPAGIAAAISSAKSGRDVLLIEPYRWVGGLVTNGLVHTDLRTLEGMSGTFLDFTRRVELHYLQTFGAESLQVKRCFRGIQFEPSVARLVLTQMLAEHPRIKVLVRHRLTAVRRLPAAEGGEIVETSYTTGEGVTLNVAARMFIDASYEGDLMAAAGIKWRIGREAREAFGESLAPVKADGQVMGYNFRLTMTRTPANRVAPSAPAGYRREEFLPIVPLLEAGKFKSVFCDNSGGFYKAQIPDSPNEKFDINDVSHSLVRLSLPHLSTRWPDGDAETRRQIFEAHVHHNVGLLYFIQTDPAVPRKFQEEARQYGWCKDEYPENHHLPEQLYVRQGRRMVGQYVYTQKDVTAAANDVRSMLHTDSIAMGDYGPNSHGTAHEGPIIGGKHTGEHYAPVPPYQIPLGVILATDCPNLLVPVACSSSHVGYTTLRYEPIWTALGQAAGHAAHLAIEGSMPVQKVSVGRLQKRLHADGAATIYVSDVPPGSADFAAVQWWGTVGGLHGLNPATPKPGQRGAQIAGQYYKAFPQHAAELDEPLSAEVKAGWIKLAGSFQLGGADLEGAKTRGEFIRLAWGKFSKAG